MQSGPKLRVEALRLEDHLEREADAILGQDAVGACLPAGVAEHALGLVHIELVELLHVLRIGLVGGRDGTVERFAVIEEQRLDDARAVDRVGYGLAHVQVVEAEVTAVEVQAEEPSGPLLELGHGQVLVGLKAGDVLERGATKRVDLAVLDLDGALRSFQDRDPLDAVQVRLALVLDERCHGPRVAVPALDARMAAGNPFRELEGPGSVDALLAVLVAQLGSVFHIHDVPVAGLDDVEEVVIGVLQVDDKGRGVRSLHAFHGTPQRRKWRSVLGVVDAIVNGLDRDSVERCAGVELEAAPDLEGDRLGVLGHGPLLGQLGHVVALRIIGDDGLVDGVEGGVVPVGVDRVQAREVEVVALAQCASPLRAGALRRGGGGTGGEQSADRAHAEAEREPPAYELAA